MEVLASLFISLATSILRVVLQQRQAANDAHEVGRLQGAIGYMEQANHALQWRANAVRDPDRADDLWVQDGASRLELPGHDAPPRGPTDQGTV